MSNRYKGGIISATPPTTTGGNDGVASGAWTLEQQMQLQAAGLWPNQPIFYIENVFSTYLYTSTGGDITITNGIDLSTKGGLVWIKSRSNAFDHYLTDTVRGAGRVLYSNLVNGQSGPGGGGASSFSTTGYVDGNQNANGVTQVSWTFRKQPKFFDIVTYTGDGVAGRTVAHNLGSVPGSIIVKETSVANDWLVYHRNDGTTAQIGLLNSSQATFNNNGNWFGNGTSAVPPTSTEFTVSTSTRLNSTGETYVAYVFAHNAGGFGLTGTDNVISCGSFTTDGSGNATVSLGYEPQWLLTKSTDLVDQWYLLDSMRGWPVTTASTKILASNTSGAETTGTFGNPTATGFTIANGGATKTYIYIAIRRGPMKVPTLGTSVFSPNTWTGNDTARSITGTNFSPDLTLIRDRSAATGYSFVVNDKLRGSSNVLRTFNADSESTGITQGVTSFNMNGISLGTDSSNYGYNRSPNPEIGEFFARAPGFFDEVCYTGSGSTTTQTHNLGVVPEMMIFKSRSLGSGWKIYSPAGNASKALDFTSGALADNGTYLNEVSPTASVFTIGGAGGGTNNSAETYVAYLFATCPGVSKVGSYTGTATTLQIDCGFTAGSRFVLIKRTDSTGDWYVWDSARGIVAGNDPYLLLNSTAAEVTNTDYVDTYNAGFEISSTAPAGINANGGTYIFLAIA